MVLIAFVVGLVMIMAFASGLFFLVTLVMRKALGMRPGKKGFWWIASLLTAVLNGVLLAALVLATARSALGPFSAFAIYFCMSWLCSLPMLLVLRRNWRRNQLPDPASIFE